MRWERASSTAMEWKLNIRRPHGGGRMEAKKGRHSHALHGDERGEECMRHNVKRKEKHRDSVAVIG